MYYNIYITQEAKSYEKAIKRNIRFVGRRENDHTISTLAAKFEVSERTIRNDIKDINDYLKEQEIKPIRFGSNGLIVMEEDISQARETTQQEDFYTYKLSKEERRMLAAATKSATIAMIR